MGHAKYFVCKKNCLGDISLKIVTYLALFLSHEHFRIWVTCAVVKTTSANNNFKLKVIKTVLFEGCLGRKLQKKDVLFLVLNCSTARNLLHLQYKTQKQTNNKKPRRVDPLADREKGVKNRQFSNQISEPHWPQLYREGRPTLPYRYREVKNRLYNHHNGLPVATLNMTFKKLLILTGGNVSHTFCSCL